jgi:HEXXH motif-containing protein
LSVEVLPPAEQQRYDISGCRFWEVDELAQGAALDVLAGALDEVAEVPDLADTVGQLARCIHLIVPNDDAYDVNFSEPELPFSVFVSIPLRPLEQMRWRVAEAIVHEAAHLQLSLVERIVPLIASPQSQHYSPWRKTARSVSGVLHGLYVFGVIAEWISRSSAPAAHVRQRLAEIAREAEEIHDFPEASSLTHTGAALARSILSRISAATHVPVSAESENEETFQETR